MPETKEPPWTLEEFRKLYPDEVADASLYGKMLATVEALDAARAESEAFYSQSEKCHARFERITTALKELHAALAVCPGFNPVATDRIWEALNDTHAALGEKP